MSGKKEEISKFSYDLGSLAFVFLHRALKQRGYTLNHHHCRESFWKLVMPGKYNPSEGKELILKYLSTVENYLNDVISKKSIAYWLYSFRRLAPKPIGENRSPITVLYSRSVLEAAFQKYGMLEKCNRIRISNEVKIEEIFKGLIMAKEFKMIREAIKNKPQVVLTDFGVEELIELYDSEKLAYEIWKSSADLRILGKGSPLQVDENPVNFYDLRTDELDKLVTIYDERIENQGVHFSSSRGVVFDDYEKNYMIWLPSYNVKGDSELIKELAKKFFNINIKGIEKQFEPNFLWFPFNLKGFYESHRPFSAAFEKKNNVSLESIICVIGALCLRVIFFWEKDKERSYFFRSWQRAYEVPLKTEIIKEDLRFFCEKIKSDLQINEEIDIDSSIEFLKLNSSKQAEINLIFPGPHSIFLPYDSERMFIDYAWIHNRLFYLFYDIELNDQNFKGGLLEKFTQSDLSVLPTKPCKSYNQGDKQIDVAFEIENLLIVGECRAISISIGFQKGDTEAIKFRKEKVVDKILSDVDKKAIWLAQNPIGKNYDISKFSAILPIGITPFVEFIPSLNSKYWLTENLPRVLTPNELKSSLENNVFKNVSTNLVRIKKENT